jgi:hypothetical protein
MFNHIFMEVFMKTLKVGALALGMMFAGSVMAMDEDTTLRLEIANLYAALTTEATLLTPYQKGIMGLIPQRLESAYRDRDRLNELRDQLSGFASEIKFKQSMLGKIVLPTKAFIKTHPKKLGVLAAVAVLTVAYVAYKKYTAKKKLQVEEEDETEEVTVE